MTPEKKQQWLDALRSGKYKKGSGQLHVPERDEYCCLGVYCDAVLGIDLANERTMDLPTYLATGIGARFIGSLTPLGEDVSFDDRNDLADMNDRGDSFATIADWIEANL